MNKIKMNNLDETIYHETLFNGLNVYIYKKSDFAKKGAYFLTKYGSATNEFVPINEDKMKSFPKGIAHFLEHKLFESDDNISVFEKFKKYGAYVNAYTNHTVTNYYFSCVNNFYECLTELIDFVQKPYFTLENVEKEKGIINEEINMTEDDIDRYMYEELFDMTLNTNPNKYRTIGSKEEINKITKKDLYTCYNTFYNPSNMILVCYGDIDEQKTIDLINNNQSKKEFKKMDSIKVKEYDEIKEVKEKYKEIKRNVVIPKVSICYKLKIPKLTGEELFKKILFLNLFLDMKFGNASTFEKDLINNGIIENYLSYNYTCFDDVILIMFEADCNNKDLFISKIDEKIKDKDFDYELFELDKKVIITNLVKVFENPNSVSSLIYNQIIKYGSVINNVYDIYKDYTCDLLKEEFNSINFDNKSVLYVTKKEN